MEYGNFKVLRVPIDRPGDRRYSLAPQVEAVPLSAIVPSSGVIG